MPHVCKASAQHSTLYTADDQSVSTDSMDGQDVWAGSRNLLWVSMAMENDGLDPTGMLGPLDS